jgi:hypothetical protein
MHVPTGGTPELSRLESNDASSSNPNDLAEEDLRAVVRKSSLSDPLWRQFVGSHQRFCDCRDAKAARGWPTV